jgi:hypothetical protein
VTNARRFAVVLGLLLVVAVPIGLLGPTKPDLKAYDTGTYDTAAYNSAVAAALSDATTNEARSQGAPQQAVVNGWLARDLAVIQIKQANDEINQNVTRIRQTNDLLVLEHMIAAMLVAVVLALILVGLTGRRPEPIAAAEETLPPTGSPAPPGPPGMDRNPNMAWPVAAAQGVGSEWSGEPRLRSEVPPPAGPGQAGATVATRTSLLPAPTSAVEAQLHLVAEHGWPDQPAEAAMVEAHRFAHGSGRPDLADEDLTHGHSF